MGKSYQHIHFHGNLSEAVGLHEEVGRVGIMLSTASL